MIAEKDLELILHKMVVTPEEMQELCVEVVRKYLLDLPVSILLLEGELGAGKTAFCRGFMKALDISENINSPTFNLLNEYEGSSGRLHHYDLYRIRSPQEAAEAGFTERWSGADIIDDLPLIQAIEWWRRAEVFFPVPAPTFYTRIFYNVDDKSEARDVTVYRHVADRTRY